MAWPPRDPADADKSIAVFVAEHIDRPAIPGSGRDVLRVIRHLTGTGVGLVVAAGQCVGFWLAVVLPFLALSLLASGVSTAGERQALAALVALNLLALYAGKDHEPT